MDASDSLRMEEIMKSFTGINASLAAINTDMDTAHGELKTLIEAVERYVQADSYPKVEVICAILGISSGESDQDRDGDV